MLGKNWIDKIDYSLTSSTGKSPSISIPTYTLAFGKDGTLIN